MEPVHTAQILPPRFRSIFLIILPQKDFLLNIFIDFVKKIHFITMIFNA